MQDDTKKCIVCTMPLVNVDDYPEGCDVAVTLHCKHCGTKNGLHPYTALITGMAGFISNTQGMDMEQAKVVAKQMIDNSEAIKQNKLKIEE